MPGKLVWKQVDYDRDFIQVSFDIEDVTAVNYDAQLTAADALITAMGAITLGNQVYRDFVSDRDETDPITTPASGLAQSNIQWIFEYSDNINGRVFRTRVGCADLTAISGVLGGVPYIDLGSGAGATLKAAFEAIVVSEDGNAVTLESVTYRE